MSVLSFKQLSRVLNASKSLFFHNRGHDTIHITAPVVSCWQNLLPHTVIPSSSFSTSQTVYQETQKKRKRQRFQGPYQEVSPEFSARYIESDAYKNVYGDGPVWLQYRRNYKGHIQPRVRRACTADGKYKTRNPCPVCRDNYLRIHYRNPKLLMQFTSENTYHVRDNYITGVCRKQQNNVNRHLALAMDKGIIEAPIPLRTYNYKLLRKAHGIEEE